MSPYGNIDLGCHYLNHCWFLIFPDHLIFNGTDGLYIDGLLHYSSLPKSSSLMEREEGQHFSQLFMALRMHGVLDSKWFTGVPLLICQLGNFVLVNVAVKSFESCSYLTGVCAARLQEHLTNMEVHNVVHICNQLAAILNSSSCMKIVEYFVKFPWNIHIHRIAINNPALVQIMVWCQTGYKPLFEPIMAYFTDTYVSLSWCHCNSFQRAIWKTSRPWTSSRRLGSWNCSVTITTHFKVEETCLCSQPTLDLFDRHSLLMRWDTKVFPL